MGNLEPIVNTQTDNNSERFDASSKSEGFSYLTIPDNSQLLREFQQRYPNYYIFLTRYGSQVETKYARMQRQAR